MAVPQNSGPPLSKDILAYNSNSDRGWNDPPTLAFASTNASTPRKRLDLRKRVAHGCVSGTNSINAGMQNLNLNQQQPITNIANQHNTMNVKPGQNLNGSNLIDYNRSHSIGPNLNAGPPMYNAKQSLGSNVFPGYLTPPVMQTPNIPEPSHHLAHSTSMPNLQHQINGDLFEPNGAPLPENRINQVPVVGNAQFSMHRHVPLSKPPTSEGSSAMMSNAQGSVPVCNSSHVGNPLFYFSGQESHPAVANAVSKATTNLRSSAEIVCSSQPQNDNKLPGGHNALQSNTTMPEMSKSQSEHPHHVRSSSLPNFEPLPNAGTTGDLLSAPPIDGYYTKRSNSACSSREGKSSPGPSESKAMMTGNTEDGESDKLNGTLERINLAIDKCSMSFEEKVLDEVKKRVDIFSKSWQEDILSMEVKSKMVLLSTALSDQKYEEAEKIHQSLIVDYSSEVRQWMVGIKKLISLCKQIAIQNENN